MPVSNYATPGRGGGFTNTVVLVETQEVSYAVIAWDARGIIIRDCLA